MVWFMVMVGVALGGQERGEPEVLEEAEPEVQQAIDAGPSADLGVLAPALRRARAGQAEVAVHQGVMVFAVGVSAEGALDGAGSVTALRAGVAPVDRLWVEARVGYGGSFAAYDEGAGLVYGSASYALVDTPGFRTGPSLAAGYAGSLSGGSAFGAVGWGAVASFDPVSFDATLHAVGAPAGAMSLESTVLPYWEVGMTVQPEGSPHSVRVGLAAVAPTAAYRFEQDAWFLQVHATAVVLPGLVGAESGLEVGARW